MKIKYENKDKYFEALFILRDAINELQIEDFEKESMTIEEITKNNEVIKNIRKCIRDIGWYQLRHKNSKP